MSVRLASGVWVSAYLTRLRLADIPAYVTAKGDATAGAVGVKVALLDGTARAFEASRTRSGTSRHTRRPRLKSGAGLRLTPGAPIVPAWTGVTKASFWPCGRMARPRRSSRC